MSAHRSITQSTRTATLADVLDRVLDKGMVIAGDIRIKLVDIELLTIQIRLVVCSVDKAVEMGMNWWTLDPNLSPLARGEGQKAPELARRVEELEAALGELRQGSASRS